MVYHYLYIVYTAHKIIASFFNSTTQKDITIHGQLCKKDKILALIMDTRFF